MDRTTKVSLLALVALSVVTTAGAAEEKQQNVVAVADRRWTLDLGLSDARHRSLLYPNDSLQHDAMRFEQQSVPAPHEEWGFDLSVSYRLPKGAGRLTGRLFLEDLGDTVSGNSVGIAVPYELPDGTLGTAHRDVNPDIEPLLSHTLTWSRTFLSRGAYSLQHELGFVSRRLSYWVNDASLGQGTRVSLQGPRLGLTATRRLAQGAAIDVALGCTVARRSERASTSDPVYYPERQLQTYLTTEDMSHSWRLVQDISLVLRVPLSGRLAGTLGYRWEGYGGTFMGPASAYGAFVALKIGIGG